MTALVGAARRFDKDKGAAFSTYAVSCVLGELKRYFRDRAWAMRVPRKAQELYLETKHANDDLRHRLGRSHSIAEIAVELNAADEAVLEAMEAGASFYPTSLDAPRTDDGPSLLDRVVCHEHDQPETVVDRVAVQAYLRTLTVREQQLLKLLFFDEQTQADVGRQIGISQMQVSRLLARLLTRIRADLTTEH